MMKFSSPSIFNILNSIFCGSLFSDLWHPTPETQIGGLPTREARSKQPVTRNQQPVTLAIDLDFTAFF